MVKLQKEKNNCKSIARINKGHGLDFVLLFTVIILLFIGIIALSSASSYYSLKYYNNSVYLLTKQIIFGIFGVILMLIISKINYNKYLNVGYLGYLIGIFLMLAVFIPGLGKTINGASRWLNLGIFTFQPSEVMKILLIIAISAYMIKNSTKTVSVKDYFIPACMILLVGIIMYFQSHMSGAMIMFFLGGILIIASGIKLKAVIVIPFIIISLALIVFFLFSEPYRLKRVTSFFNPESNMMDSNWQPVQSLYAIGSGGVFGRGLGQSLQKYSWLPEAQNDFVFSVFAEEFGFVGCIIVISLYAFFIIKGFVLALNCNNKFGRLLTVGIISMFAFQAIINIAVVTSSMPTTGMPLPFFSSGGTSLVINLVAVGIMLNVSRNNTKQEVEK